MPWSAHRAGWSARPITLAVLLSGLWLFGIGEAALVNSSLGNTPWTVLAEGIANHSRLDIGGATILVSVLVLVGWIPLRQLPALGTLANVIHPYPTQAEVSEGKLDLVVAPHKLGETCEARAEAVRHG